MAIKLLLADPHTLFRQGLKKLLEGESDFEVIAEASNGLEAQRMVKDFNPDLAIIDYNLPLLDGASLTKNILDFNNSLKVIILTALQNDQAIFDSVRSGAQAYLLKNIDISELLHAIRQVYQGRSLIDPSITNRLLLEFRRLSEVQADKVAFGALSPREVSILRLLASGMSNKEIANNLFLSEKTVKNYLTLIFHKIQVNDRVQAAIYAIHNGLV